MFWGQCRDFFDGRVGVWTVTCTDPDAPKLVWSEPRRIADGLMLNKPIVAANGTWLLPIALWACQEPTEDHGLEALRFSNVYASDDNGQTFALRGSADIPNRSFDEHMLVERRDQTLWMLVRCFDGIGESTSIDGGRTWEPGHRSSIDGPCSRFHIRRLPSGRLLLVNHSGFAGRSTSEDLESQGNVKEWKGRSHLTAMLSEDEGQSWTHRLLIDERDGVSYPDVAIDGQDLYIVYDYDRMTSGEILMARITESDILAGEIISPDSVLRILVNKANGEPVVAASA
jgi:predicted neuraminidase